MGYFHAGITILQIIILISFVLLLKQFTLNKKDINQKILNAKRDFGTVSESLSEEIWDRIEEMESGTKEIEDQLATFLQQQVSWRTVKKELPSSLTMVILLEEKTKVETKGFLSDSLEEWTVNPSYGTLKKLSLWDVSHWKPILDKKTALNP